MQTFTFIRKLCLSLLVLAIFSQLQAQNLPVKIQVITPVPPPFSSTELMKRLNEPLLVITNTGANNQEIALYGKITANNGIAVILDPFKKKPRRSLSLGAFASATLSFQDIIDNYSNYALGDLATQGINLVNFLQNQLVPEGNYDLCVTAYDFNNLTQLSDNAPNGCSQQMQVKHPDPPIITNPLNDAEVLVSSFQNINIQWSPVRAGTFNAQYKLRMVEVPRGVNPYDAMRSNNFVWLNEEKLLTPFFLYDNTRPKLKEETTYALQVVAFDPNEIVPIKNKGISDIVLFKTKKLRGETAILNTPINGTSVNHNPTGIYSFTWNSAPITGFQIYHKLTLWEVPINSSPLEAKAKANLRIIEQKDILGNSFNLIQEAYRLEPGKTYAWQIESSEPSGELIFNQSGLSNIETFTISYPELAAPIITAPSENSINPTIPMEVNVRWRHQFNYDVNVNYTLAIWEFDQAPRNLNNEIERQQPVFIQRNIQGLQKRLTGTDFYFSPGKHYAIQLVASGNQLRFQNRGISNIVSFTVNEMQANNFACNQGCEIRRPSGRAVNTINNGATITIGNFRVQLDNVSKTGNLYSGSARILAGNFFDAPININLTDVTFNSSGQALSGYAVAVFNNEVDVPVSWKNEEGEMLAIGAQIANKINALAGSAYQIGGRSNSVQNLPISYGNLFITRLKLTPTTAIANLFSYKQLGSDLQNGDQYQQFGRKNICFSPGGPATSQNQSYLMALNDVTVSENQNTRITILRQMQNAPNGGTYLSFDCSGALDVSAFGYVSLLLPGWNSGNVSLDNSRVYATFRTNFRTWNNWMADLRFVDAGARTNLSAPNQTIQISNRTFNHISFELSQALLDHSSFRNPTGLTLPEGHFRILNDNANNQAGNNMNINIGGINQQFNIGGVNLNSSPNIWTGIHLSDLKIIHMQYLRAGNENRKSYLKNFVIDGNGLSGESTLLRENLSSNDQFTSALIDWRCVISSGSCAFRESEFVRLVYNGNLTVPLFSESVSVTLEHEKAGNRINSQIISANISNTNKIIPSLNASFRLNQSAGITGLFSGNLQLPIILLNLIRFFRL